MTLVWVRLYIHVRILIPQSILLVHILYLADVWVAMCAWALTSEMPSIVLVLSSHVFFLILCLRHCMLNLVF